MLAEIQGVQEVLNFQIKVMHRHAKDNRICTVFLKKTCRGE